jgi:putative membrane protein
VVRLLARAVLYLIANSIGLLIAASVLDDMTLDGGAFVIAVLIFSAIEILTEPLLRQIAVTSAPVLLGSVALIATFIGLVLTTVISDGLSIDGAWTWVLATIIVWLATLLAGILLPLILFKKVLAENRGGSMRTA